MDIEKISAIADTGFIVALTNRNDKHHERAKIVYSQYQNILLPQTVLAETAYLIDRESGIKTVIDFLRGLKKSRFSVISVTEIDLLRVASILEEYSETRIDFVDATVMAVAERYNLNIVLTIDQRDFRLFKPKHCLYFEILP